MTVPLSAFWLKPVAGAMELDISNAEPAEVDEARKLGCRRRGAFGGRAMDDVANSTKLSIE
jgi:hypothetical protein